MIYAILTIYLLQQVLAIYAYRRGSDWLWITTICLSPLVGAFLYLYLVVFASSIDKNKMHIMFKQFKRKLNPPSELMDLKAKVLKFPSVENKQRLAHELLTAGQYLESYTMYDEISSQMYLQEPDHLFYRATAAWNLKQYGPCLAALTLLKELYPANFSHECEMLALICEQEQAQQLIKKQSLNFDNNEKNNPSSLERTIEARVKNLDSQDETIELMNNLTLDS